MIPPACLSAADVRAELAELCGREPRRRNPVVGGALVRCNGDLCDLVASWLVERGHVYDRSWECCALRRVMLPLGFSEAAVWEADVWERLSDRGRPAWGQLPQRRTIQLERKAAA